MDRFRPFAVSSQSLCVVNGDARDINPVQAQLDRDARR
jgi:hypothetical protein